jgi:AsmA protein
VDTVVLREPHIRLAVDRHGRSNWQDLAGDAPEADEPSSRASDGAPVGNVVLGGIEISAGEVVYADARSGAITRVRGLDLQVGRLAPGEKVPVKLAAVVEASAPGIVADVQLDTQLEADPQAQRYALSALSAAALLKGEGLPKDGLPVALTGEALADLGAGTARVPNVTLAVLDASLKGSGEVSGLDAKPVFAGTLELAPFSPRKVLEALGTRVETADPAALGRAQARLALRAGADAIEVRELDARLDDTPATGTLGITGFAAPRVRFDLKIGALDLDRYLAPGATEAPQARGGGEPKKPVPPPEPGLRLDELGARLGAMDVSGTLALASLKVARLRLTDVNVTLRGKDGTVRVDPLRAALYQGTVSGALSLDARTARPVVTARQTLSGVALGPLLKDLGQRESVTGRAELALDVRADGQVAAELTRTLDGTLRVQIADGVLTGINVDRAICQARAAVDTARGKDREACDPSPDSRFETLQASGTFTDGVLRSDDLLIVQPRHEAGEFYRVTGAGTVNLPRQEVDYQLRAVRTRQRDGDAAAQEKGRAIPVRVAGTFGDLSVRPDTRALAETEVKEQLKDRFGDKLETKEDDSDLERQGKELLKGLLGR